MRVKNWGAGLDSFRKQPALMEALHDPLRAAILAGDGLNYAERCGVVWALVNQMLWDARGAGARGALMLRRHEDLLREPEKAYGALFDELGLPFTSGIQAFVAATSAADNPATARDNVHHDFFRNARELEGYWRSKVTPEEIADVRRYAEPTASLFYDDASWLAGGRVEEPVSP